MSPIAPSIKSDKKDAFVKGSIQDMKTRPKLFASKNKVRQGEYDFEKSNSNQDEPKKEGDAKCQQDSSI